MSFHVIVPARYGATRLPGKPLRLLAGEPMIVHTWRRALASGAASVTVAADDPRIVDAVKGAGGQALLTRPDHPSGTDRVHEVVVTNGLAGDQVVVNLQGDEPLMSPELVAAVAGALRAGADASVATAATPIDSVDELFNPNVVKVVFDRAGLAHYFSRAPIPWVRGLFDGGKPEHLPPEPSFWRHLGLYAYRVDALRTLCAHPTVAYERAESLEQLRALDLGLRIHVTTTDQAPGPGVDTEADAERVDSILRAGQ